MPLTIRFVTRYSHVTARGGLMCDETIDKLACLWTGGVERESEYVYRASVIILIIIIVEFCSMEHIIEPF